MIEFLELEQGSDDWLKWRKTGIGASEIGTVMSVNTDQSPYEYWLIKTGRESFDGSMITDRGNMIESTVIDMIEMKNNVKLHSYCVLNSNYPYLKASLDGYEPESKTVVEVKCPFSVDIHNDSVNGIIKPVYEMQIQQQLLLTGCEDALFVSYHPEHQTPYVEIARKPNKKIQQAIIGYGKFFYENYLKPDLPPPLLESDVLRVENPSEQLKENCEKIEAMTAQIKDFEQAIESMKKRRIDLLNEVKDEVDHPNFQVGSMRVTKVKRQGNIDIYRIPELRGVDLDKYRYETTEYYKFSNIKKKDKKS